jgi:eukaryotic-like serine/threonine-protein kinase
VTGEERARVESAFLEARAADPSLRDDMLRRAFPDEPHLLREARLLLAAGEDSDAYFTDLARRAGAPDPDAARPQPAAHDQVGPYRVVGVLGRGGMGTVYLAERDDGHFHHRVALKVLRRGLDTDDIVARFRAERQILASLSHPNIARVFDGGTTDDGLPYFVMEPVEGVPITEYCDTNRLPIAARLALVERVAAAVEYAHRNLVVHRDLKPSNILVDRDGTVKLLDFGIAKVLGSDGDDVSPMTRVGVRAMTPEYASPEQVRGDAITTASDVYQLGALLYQLCAGVKPHSVRGGTGAVPNEGVEPPSAAVRRVAVEDGPSPDDIARLRRTDPRRLQARLRGDLDTIILMALRYDPDRRYPTVQQLSGDLARYRAGRTIMARPDTALYRASRFLRRNGPWVAAGTALAASLVALTLVSVRAAAASAEQARALTAERDRAEAEGGKAAEVTRFLVSLFTAGDPMHPTAPLTVRELVDRGAARIEADVASAAIQAQLMEVVGTVYRRLGDGDEAERFLESALRLHRDLDPPDSGAAASAMVALAQLLRDRGAYREAADLYREALDLQLATHEAQEPVTAGVKHGLALVLLEVDELDEAEGLFRDALEVYRANPAFTDGFDLSITLTSLGGLLTRRGDHAGAEPLLREAVDVRRQLLGDDHPRTAVALNNLARAYQAQARYDEAEPLLRESLEIRRRALGADHPEVATALNNLALGLVQTGRYDEAEPLHLESLALRRRAHGDRHPAVATALINLSDVSMGRGSPAEAESRLREAIAILVPSRGPGHTVVGQARARLGAALAAQGRVDEARAELAEALEILRAARGPDHSSLVPPLRDLGRIALARHDSANAVLLFTDALRIARNQHPDGSLRITELEAALADAASHAP